jgi:hypothetical protein
MVIDYIIKEEQKYILLLDTTHKPKVKTINIQVITPSNKIINTEYSFKKANVYSEETLGGLEYGRYSFNICGVIKYIDCINTFPLKKIYVDWKRY